MDDIIRAGDNSEDYLARTSVKWLHKLGVNVMIFLQRRTASVYAILLQTSGLLACD